MLLVALLLLAVPAGEPLGSLDEAVRWIEEAMPQVRQYDYVMTGKLRLLLPWVGRDDVGGGYIRLGEDPSGQEIVELKIGSDPSKAPRAINRWGAATEVRRPLALDPSRRAGAFFGFMKASRNETRESAETEIAEEGRKGRYFFQASVNRLDPLESRSWFLPFHAEQDYDLHDLEEAREMVLERFDTEAEKLEGRGLALAGTRCEPARGFLLALKDTTEAMLESGNLPGPSCYLHNSKVYRLVARKMEQRDRHEVRFQRHGGSRVRFVYEDVLRADFDVTDPAGRRRTSFRLWLGKSGALRGVPLQIDYQPNWWFRVILHLDPESRSLQAGASPFPIEKSAEKPEG
ncbi:MAG TPA: hypothetical protein VIG29_00665 [Vicinamibacteria bacterium]